MVHLIQDSLQILSQYLRPDVSLNGNYYRVEIKTPPGQGGCPFKSESALLTVNPNAAIALTSGAGTNIQSPCINSPITNITYLVTGGGTGAGVAGLPAGVTGSFFLRRIYYQWYTNSHRHL
ncbi:MAG: hypothetical protein IPJ37_05810 [Bacteroidales bacterium]|nr:hypothetical protein [Bacteroidales bacterium]